MPGGKGEPAVTGALALALAETGVGFGVLPLALAAADGDIVEVAGSPGFKRSSGGFFDEL